MVKIIMKVLKGLMQKKINRQGFSLLELIVAVGVFSVVATIAVGALLSISKAGKKAFYIQVNQDNLRFTLETIAREARTGFCYQDVSTPNGIVCPAFSSTNYCASTYNQAIDGPEGCFQFRNARGESVVYKRSTSPAAVDGCNGTAPVSCVLKSVLGGAAASFFPVTAREVQIQNLRFRVFGEDSSSTDNVQPRVIIVMRAQTPGLSNLSTTLDVETSVSQLLVDKNQFLF